MEIFIPRLVDAAQLNPQNNNAKMILRRWPADGANVTTFAYGPPDNAVSAHPKIRIVRLWRGRAWMLHLLLRYLRRYDAVFYPGVHAADVAGLQWRRRIGPRVPVIATLEGLVGDADRERFYTQAAGHPVYCQQVGAGALRRVDTVLREADRIIAISPFVARMGRLMYGDKISVLPLGVDPAHFYAPPARAPAPRPVVVGAGRVAPHKRPAIFLELARRFPQAQFRWYGEGEQRAELVAQARARELTNVEFPGALAPSQLAEVFRAADLFVLPSHSEGVPKVTQEAAACGLPVLVYGFYEAPSVIDAVNGFVVWNDDELFARVGELLSSPELRTRMGEVSAQMAEAWSWDEAAPRWIAEIQAGLG
jgi:glycosyltransferase involved in cell wall biosynthesis